MQGLTLRLKLAGTLVGCAAAMFAATPVAAATCKLGMIADLPVTMEGTRASVPAIINGKDTRFWLDSGAFFSIMSRAKAVELGLTTEPLPFGFYISGIGGSASVELTHIKSFGIVGQVVKDLQFLVGGTDPGNGLIGRNILAMRDTEFDLADGSVKLIDPHDCDHTVMAYWATGKPYFSAPLLPDENVRDHVFRLPVKVNGVKLDAVLDTGAETSGITRSAARRAGIDLSGPDVLSTETGGFGRHYVKGWVVPVASVSVGDEQILRTHLDVYDDEGEVNSGLPDMLLGADYIMAHHIYVARRQGLIWFTYTGGKAFRTSREPGIAKNPGAPLALPPGAHVLEAVASSASEPKTADQFARRGAARLSARDATGAIADLSEAISKSSQTAAYYADRARAYALAKDTTAENADIDKALGLDPNLALLLRVRAVRRLADNDRAGALADAEAATRVTAPASLASGELAELFVRLHQPARAIPLFSAVIAAHQDDAALPDLLNGRCWARALANVELDKALADCRQAIQHNRNRPDWLDSRGLVYFRQAKYAQAIADYDAALKLAPKLAWSLYMRGLAKIALGQDAAGQADQAAAKAVDPKIVDEVTGFGMGVRPS